MIFGANSVPYGSRVLTVISKKDQFNMTLISIGLLWCRGHVSIVLPIKGLSTTINMVDVAEARRARVVDRSPKDGKIGLIFKGDSKVRTVANY